MWFVLAGKIKHTTWIVFGFISSNNIEKVVYVEFQSSLGSYIADEVVYLDKFVLDHFEKYSWVYKLLE